MQQFTLRVPQNLAKIERILAIYRNQVLDTPPMLLEALEEQRRRLEEAQAALGDYIQPYALARG